MLVADFTTETLRTTETTGNILVIPALTISCRLQLQWILSLISGSQCFSGFLAPNRLSTSVLGMKGGLPGEAAGWQAKS
jgi:hypothetical protein